MTGINKPLFREVVRRVSEETGVPVQGIIGRARTLPERTARLAVWVDLRSRGYSLPVIAEFFDRHHTTVLKCIRRAEKGSNQ